MHQIFSRACFVQDKAQDGWNKGELIKVEEMRGEYIHTNQQKYLWG